MCVRIDLIVVVYEVGNRNEGRRGGDSSWRREVCGSFVEYCLGQAWNILVRGNVRVEGSV